MKFTNGKQNMTFTRVLKFLSIALTFCVASGVMAQSNWPNQPIKIINPFPTGGTVDQIARLLQPHLQQALGQPVIVDSRSGASGSIGTGFAAKAPPDGYTWVMVFDTHGVNPSLYPNLPFDTLKDLAPVMQIGTGSMVVTAHASTPYKSFNELVQAAKSKPGTIGYGTIGSGSMAHLAMASLGNSLKVDWTHIPYKGGGPLATDGVAGHVPVTMATYALWAPHFASGRLRPLAVTSPKRMPELPEVPTLQELGVAGFEAQAYWGLLGPAGIPSNIVNRMNAEVAKALKIPAVQERLTQMGVVVTASSPAEFDRFIRTEIEKWGKVVRDNNIKAGQ
jgi:tripartite-type tricarboxylate transporter receptor subunit TctC